jgi:hypothetical protein
MDNTTFFMILVGIVGLLTLYYRTWRSKEGYAPPSKDTLAGEAAAQKARDEIVVEEELNKPYALDPIRSVDDYEYSMVFRNEGDRAMTKATRDALMSKYPLDWSVQPPSSAMFQSGLAGFKEAFANAPPPQQGNPYRNIDGSQMVPPDTQADEMKEREILQTYTPKDPQSLTTYNAADAKELIEKIYDAKGLVAEYKETAPNQFTIVSTRKKNEKIVYEDDPSVAPASASPIAAAGEGTIVVPAVAAEVQSGLDPFFTPSTKTRDGKWDYTSWTPGLERMFAPTEPQTNWY